MGDIAATAPGDADLGKELRTTFVDRNFAVRIGVRARNRGKEPSRAAARDCNLFVTHTKTYHADDFKRADI